MSTQGFQLDPSLAKLPLALLRKKYDELSPEERVRLGFVRPATAQEFQAAQQPPGAPADFGGPVYPSSTPPVVSDDTDSGIPITRTPTGVSFQKQNAMSGPSLHTSNPPAAELATPGFHTIGAQFNPTAPYEKEGAAAGSGAKFDPGAGYEAEAAPPPPAEPNLWDKAKHFATELGAQINPVSMVKGAAQITSDPVGSYEADAAVRQKILDKAKTSFGKGDYAEGLAHGLYSMLPFVGANLDRSGEQFKAGDIAGGAGSSIGQGLALAAPALVPKAVAALRDVATPPPIPPRAAPPLPEGFSPAGPRYQPPPGTVDNPAPAQATPTPAVSESSTDALAREGDIEPVLQKAYRDTLTQKIGNPDTSYADRIRAVTELHELDHPELKQIEPRSADATRQRFKGMSPEPATAPNASPAASQTPETAQEPTLRESLAAPPPKSAIKPSQVEQTLREALGASAPLKKNVPLKYQGAGSATTPAPEPTAPSSLPKNFTPVKSSVLAGYDYDPETREFHSVTHSGKHYVTGEITPKDVEDFQNADSQGSAWTNIIRSRGTPLGEMVEGKLKPWRTKGVTATPDDLSPLDQKLKNLQDFLQPSAKSTKSLSDLDAPSEDLTGEWGQALTKVKKARKLRELQ